MGVESVGHELKFAIRRDEWDSAVIFKSWKADTLVELDIFQFNSFTFGTCKWQNKKNPLNQPERELHKTKEKGHTAFIQIAIWLFPYMASIHCLKHWYHASQLLFKVLYPTKTRSIFDGKRTVSYSILTKDWKFKLQKWQSRDSTGLAHIASGSMGLLCKYDKYICGKPIVVEFTSHHSFRWAWTFVVYLDEEDENVLSPIWNKSKLNGHKRKTLFTVHLRPVVSNRILSLSPSRSSGIPVRYTLIFTEPTISLCSTLPFPLTWIDKTQLL